MTGAFRLASACKRTYGLHVSGQEILALSLFGLTGWIVRNNWLAGRPRTGTVAVAVLSAAFGSGVPEEMEAVAETDGQLTGVAEKVTWAVAWLAMSPR